MALLGRTFEAVLLRWEGVAAGPDGRASPAMQERLRRLSDVGVTVAVVTGLPARVAPSWVRRRPPCA